MLELVSDTLSITTRMCVFLHYIVSFFVHGKEEKVLLTSQPMTLQSDENRKKEATLSVLLSSIICKNLGQIQVKRFEKKSIREDLHP